MSTTTWLQRERARVRADASAARVAEERPALAALIEGWNEPVPGSPLGVGMPSGTTLREDGETHLEAWQRILRADPCAVCERPVSGTVDHVEPKSRGGRYRMRWTNLVGMCETCNGSKSDRPLLLWLASRRGQAPKRAGIQAGSESHAATLSAQAA